MCLSSHLGGKETILAAMSLNWGECLEVCSSEWLMVTPEYRLCFVNVRVDNVLLTFIHLLWAPCYLFLPWPRLSCAHCSYSRPGTASLWWIRQPYYPATLSSSNPDTLLSARPWVHLVLFLYQAHDKTFPHILLALVLSYGKLEFVDSFWPLFFCLSILLHRWYMTSDLHSPGLGIHRVRFCLRHGQVTISA